jgi:SAM-dependent methyltransferase
MRNRLFQVYWKLREVIAPELVNAQYLYEEVLGRNVFSETSWLDLGCGHQLLPFWRAEEERILVEKCASIVGLDRELPALHKHRSVRFLVAGDASTLPFKNQQFDLVTANMVVEHLSNPNLQFHEINRVLKPGGIFIFHTPNALGYPAAFTNWIPPGLRHRLAYLLDGRQKEDVFETHYLANSRPAITELAKPNGFEVEKIRLSVSDAVFALVAPIAILELMFIKLLMTDRLKDRRTNLIAILRKKRH